jgi:putative ABC transport system substrate-binding protein
MAAKWLEMLNQITPPVSKVAALFNPATAPFAHFLMQAIEKAAPTFAMTARALPCRDEVEIAQSMMELARENRTGIIVLPDYFTLQKRQIIIDSASRNRVPAIYWVRTFVVDGGLMSYGVDNYDMLRQSATYVDRILKGANPGDLPVQYPSKFRLAINLRAVNALGLTVAASLLAAADEVIE